jgi:hypothetical protein
MKGSSPYHSINYLYYGAKNPEKHIRDFNPDIIHFQEGGSFMFTRIFGLGKIKILTDDTWNVIRRSEKKKENNR